MSQTMPKRWSTRRSLPASPSQIWLAALDRSSPPQLVSASGEDSPHFGPDGRIVFRILRRNQPLSRADEPGWLGPLEGGSISDRQHPVHVSGPALDHHGRNHAGCRSEAPLRCQSREALPSGSVRLPVTWAPDGKFLYLFVQKPSLDVILVRRGSFRYDRARCCPKLPPLGMRAPDDPKLFPGSYLIDAYGISPSPDPSVYAYVKTTMHRNLFRIPLPVGAVFIAWNTLAQEPVRALLGRAPSAGPARS